MSDIPKPIKKSQRQPANLDTRKQPARERPSERPRLNIQSEDAKAIPLMFQAQIQDRGNIQYAGDPKIAGRWVEQWLEGCPPVPKAPDPNLPVWKRLPTQPTIKLPEFGPHVQTWEYQIRWRMVMNSGQDEGVIRPVIGAKGMPFFPGSSMKGVFRRACPKGKRMRYCGSEVIDQGEKRTKPGILRFHGGYPVNMDWGRQDRLVDVAHGQEDYQVKDSSARHNANVLISLYQPKFKFGISSTENLEAHEWEEIREIWEQALGHGIGSRVSAGYGYMADIQPSKPALFSIYLSGQGISSQLLLGTSPEAKFKTSEFRPSMFKAALRGHTWRLLAGVTDEKTAQTLTYQLWGGIGVSAVVGCIGIDWLNNNQPKFGEHIYQRTNQQGKPVKVAMPIYELQSSHLNLLKVGETKPELEEFLKSLIQFSMLLGGFGKSWRRVHHKLFYPSYFQQNNKPMIGCHWEFAPQSEDLCVTVNNNDLTEIKTFLENIQTQTIAWLQAEGYQPSDYVKTWRETWHPNKVQVWGRIARNRKDSRVVQWFHDDKILKGSTLAGQMGRIGRTWHRMYPRYVKGKDGSYERHADEFVELLTIFPDESDKTRQFIEFLQTGNHDFQNIWGGRK